MTYKQAKVHVHSCTHTTHTHTHSGTHMWTRNITHTTYTQTRLFTYRTNTCTHSQAHTCAYTRAPTQPQGAKITYPERTLALLGTEDAWEYSVKPWMPALGKRMRCHDQGFSFSSTYECKRPSLCPVCLPSHNKSDILGELVSLPFPNATMTHLLKKDLRILKCRNLFKIDFKINYLFFVWGREREIENVCAGGCGLQKKGSCP